MRAGCWLATAALLAGRRLADVPLEDALRRACDDVAAILREVQARGWPELALPLERARELA